MDYHHVAARVLFGDQVLSNSMRGLYIEALIYDAVCQHGRGDWHYIGLNWGPWDLQRGRHADNSRVRFQVKVAAEKQLWERSGPSRTFSLGRAHSDELPSYFVRDFPADVVGEIELKGYRCDYFLLAWHGPHPIAGTPVRSDDQSDPNAYDYFIVPVAGLTTKSLSVRAIFERFREPIRFSRLTGALNDSADKFLRERPGKLSDGSPSPVS